MKRLSCFLILSAFLAVPCFGELVNGDFEYWGVVRSNSDWEYVSDSATEEGVGWTATASCGYTENPWYNDSYPGYELVGTNGRRTICISWGHNNVGVYQILDDRFSEGVTYTFSIDVYGDGADAENWCIGMGAGGVTSEWNAIEQQRGSIVLKAGNAVIGPDYLADLVPWADGDYTDYTVQDDTFSGWQTRSITYTATAAESGLPIMVHFSGGFVEEGADTLTQFDNAVLTIDAGPMAWTPDPPDRALVSPIIVGSNVYLILNYAPGDGAISHNGYFSDNYDDVLNRVEGANLGAPPYADFGMPTEYFVGYDDAVIPEFAMSPLVRGRTYYWAIDEFDGVSTTTGSIWSFTVMTEKAYDPNPADGAEKVFTDPNVTLSWKEGDVDSAGNKISYDVYYGTDLAAVAAATTPNKNVPTTTCQIGPLAGSTLYAWRIDTVLIKLSPPFDETRIEGDIWQFETLFDIPITDPHLLGWWKFDDDVYDWSGHGNHGTVNGSPQYVAGLIDNAMSFDGAGKSVTVPQLLQDDFTISLWVKTTQVGGVGQWWEGVGLVDAEVGGSGTDFGAVLSGDYFGFGMGPDDTTIVSTTPINDGNWHHVAAVRVADTGLMEVYVDGVLENSATASTEPRTFPPKIAIGMIQTGTGYFDGLIDDVRLYDCALCGKYGSPTATIPSPYNGAADVSRTPTLTWLPGTSAAAVEGSELYFNEDLAAVRDRTAAKIPLTNPTYPVPGLLDMGATYYWAVDTVNGVDVWPGDVWSFTTVGWLPIDDMETYTPWNITGNNIFEAWRDAEGNCVEGNGNNSGAALTEDTDIVLSGGQSMKFDFDNDGTIFNPCNLTQDPGHLLYSRIEAQVAALPSGVGSDWTIEGVKAISLNFYGTIGNATADPLWVQLKDGTTGYGNKVYYGDFAGEEAAHLAEESWHTWNIDMADFGVDLNDVVSITIAIGNEGSAISGGSGTIYFDDIRLYTPRCIAARRSAEFAEVDWKEDCRVDYADLEMLADAWLGTDLLGPGKALGDGPINFEDYAVLMTHWLEKELWP